MNRVVVMMWKELIELRSDPRLFSILIVAPILQLLLLGYAATTDIRHVPVIVADADRSPSSRDLIARFQASPSFTVVKVVTVLDEVEPSLERGEAWMALAIQAGFGEGVQAGRPQIVGVVADGSDANSTNIALGYATNLVAGYAAALAAQRAGVVSSAVTRRRPGIELRTRVWFNPRLESRDFMIPGVLALLLLVITTNLASMGVVREKELGTLEQLNVTPLRRWELIVGKLLPYGVIGMLDVVIVLAVALFWFEVPLRGSVWLLLGVTPVYLLCTLALGLLMSTISSTQQQAMMTTTFFFLIPMVYLSGFVFPIENMPDVIQWVTYLIPLRYYLVILRSIFLKGVGLETLWPETLALLAWGGAVLGLAIARSKKRMA